MNIFFIPSWYPSVTNPLPGIFFREQALALVKHFKDVNVGISTWGQNDERLLLWARQPIRSLNKLLVQDRPLSQTNELIPGRLAEYFTPKFTWSSKFLKGNMSGIIEANLKNLKNFQKQVGKVDIIHAHVGYPAGHIARVLSQRTGKPYIITEQMSPFPHKYYKNKRGNLMPALQQAYKYSSQNIAISNALATDMKSYGIENIEVISNLVDEDFFKLTNHKNNNEGFTFFTLARMVQQKGIDILLKAFSKMDSDVILKIGGDGPELRKYQNLAKELKIDHKIVWLGELGKDQALHEYQNCDAFVLPSRHESMGVVFAEAMACGKPVIGTICGGPEEFIDETAGYLVSPDEVIELSVSMGKMVEHYQELMVA